MRVRSSCSNFIISKVIPLTYSLSSGLTESMLEEILESHGLILRDGFESFCGFLSDMQIPLIVSTAGLADVVEGALKRWDLYSGNNTKEEKEEGKIDGTPLTAKLRLVL